MSRNSSDSTTLASRRSYFGLACAYLTLDKLTDARYWIEESLESEREALSALLRESRGITDGRGAHKNNVYFSESELEFLNAILRERGGIASTGRHAIEARIKKKRVEIIQRFLYFANAVEICTAAICGQPEAKILELSEFLLHEKSLTLPRVQLPDS